MGKGRFSEEQIVVLSRVKRGVVEAN